MFLSAGPAKRYRPRNSQLREFRCSTLPIGTIVAVTRMLRSRWRQVPGIGAAACRGGAMGMRTVPRSASVFFRLAAAVLLALVGANPARSQPPAPAPPTPPAAQPAQAADLVETP